VSKRKAIATQVIELVKAIRLQMPKTGARKLYYLLETALSDLSVGRDKPFRTIKDRHSNFTHNCYGFTMDYHCGIYWLPIGYLLGIYWVSMKLTRPKITIPIIKLILIQLYNLIC
jgi:hypothetical protein